MLVNNEYNALSDHGSLPSIAEMMELDPERDESVRSEMTTLQTSPAAHLPSASTQNLFTPGMASPLGLSRPGDRTFEDKILRGD